MSSNINPSSIKLSDLIQVMKAILSGNNQAIQSATKFLKIYSKTRQSIGLLTEILMNNPDVSLRQLAAVLLKRNIIKLFSNLSNQQQEEFKKILLLQFHKQTSVQVQKSVAALIGLLLPIVELKNWEDLKNLFQITLAQTPNSIATLVLLNNLLYHFNPPAEIVQYLIKSLEVENLTEYALKCILAIVQTQEKFDASIGNQVIKIWQNKSWGEQIGFNCLEIFSAMAQKKGKITIQLVFWICKKVIANTKFSEKLRSAGLDFIHTATENQQKLLISNEAVFTQIINIICLVCSQPPKQNINLEEEALQDVSLWLIETFSITFKQKKIYPILFQAVKSLINSNEVFKMNTGYLVLASMTQGCAEKIKKDLNDPIMSTLIPHGLANPAPEVRGAAINALCYFSQLLVPNIVDFHATIIPAMMKYMGDLSYKVAQKALIALDVFFDNMEQDQIKKYLSIIIPRLIEVLLKNESTNFMKRASLSTVGTLIIASQLEFQPYLPLIYKINLEILKLPSSPEANGIRAQNISVLGKLANTFCKQESQLKSQFFTNGIFPVLEPIYSILTKQTDPQVRQSCFEFFYNLASAINTNFQIVFDKVIVQVLNVCYSDPDHTQKKQNEFSLDSDSDNQEVNLKGIKTTLYEQKATAINALGEFAKACPVKFLPYFQNAYQILELNHNFHFQNIKIQVIKCYENLTLALIKSKNNNTIPPFKFGLPCVQRYPAQLESHFSMQLIPRLIFLMTSQQSSSQVTATAIDALDKLIQKIGPVLIDKSLDLITSAIIKMLEGTQNQIEEESETDSQQDTDAYVFEPLCDLIPTLSKCLRQSFSPYYQKLYPSMFKYAEDREQISDNTAIIGTFAQVFKYVPNIIEFSQQSLYPKLKQLKYINDQELNRNIAYCLGVMFQNSPNSMSKYLGQGLINLKDIYDISIALPTKQNAIAAICRILYTYNPKIPLQEFLANMIKLMPLKGDETEERTLLKTIIYISQINGLVLRPYISDLIKIIENDLKDTKKYKLKQPFLGVLNNFYLNLKQL